MASRVSRPIDTAPALTGKGIGRLISAIGRSDFADEFLLHINEICPVEHCSIVQFSNSRLYGRASASLDHSRVSQRQLKLYVDGDFWRRDPGFIAARKQHESGDLSLVKIDIDEIKDRELREKIWSSQNVRQRLALWVGTVDNALLISLVRTNQCGEYKLSEIADLQNSSEPWLASLKKHAAVCWLTPRFPVALNSLAQIESCMAAFVQGIPWRESQVCARLIYGMSTTGIALDLNIGEGSVMTYRKRLHERLHIGSQRELLVWYLTLWNEAFNHCLEAA